MKLTDGKKSNWIKADQCKKGEVVLFVDEGRIEVSDKYKYENGDPKKSIVLTVSHLGEEKQMRLNKQSRVACIESWGDETQGWIGKQASITIFPTPDGTKKMIVLTPCENEWK